MVSLQLTLPSYRSCTEIFLVVGTLLISRLVLFRSEYFTTACFEQGIGDPPVLSRSNPHRVSGPVSGMDSKVTNRTVMAGGQVNFRRHLRWSGAMRMCQHICNGCSSEASVTVAQESNHAMARTTTLHLAIAPPHIDQLL